MAKIFTLAVFELAACKPALKSVICFFITLKGFAITRKLREQLKAKSRKLMNQNQRPCVVD
jgi:hypothetical protein